MSLKKSPSFYALCGLLLASAGSLTAQTPAINAGGVINAASYANPDLPNGSIAQGSMFVIFGTNLGPANLVQATSFPLPTAAGLGGTRVRVILPAQQGGVQTTDCIMVYASATQVAAIMPSSVNTGAGNLEVVVNNVASERRPIRVVASSFGAFTVNQGGSGPAVVQNFNSESDLPLNSVLNPARPGQTVILWGTGVGPNVGDEAAGPRPGDLTSIGVQVFVGGRLANLRYRGRSGCCAGIDQIVFDIPQGVEGCFVPLAVRIGNTISNYSSISVAPPGRGCSSPFGFTDTELAQAQGSGSLRLGSILLQRSSLSLGLSIPGVNIPDSVTDLGSADFVRYTAGQLVGSTGTQPPLSIGACTVFPATQSQTGFVDPVRPVGLDAGAAVNITGPGGAKSLPKGQVPGNYSATLSGTSSNPLQPAPTYLAPGNYTFNNGTGGSGSDAVGPFNFTVAVPAPLNWTNREQVNNIDRNAGQLVSWSGGDPAGYTNIFGFGLTSTQSNAVGLAFICMERTSVGQFTIPPSVLLALPQSPQSGGLGSFGGVLGLGATTNPVRFTAPGLDVGVALASTTSIKIVNYQ